MNLYKGSIWLNIIYQMFDEPLQRFYLAQDYTNMFDEPLQRFYLAQDYTNMFMFDKFEANSSMY
jgi:hypothetical protein